MIIWLSIKPDTKAFKVLEKGMVIVNYKNMKIGGHI